jgi:hypothetical protein
LPEADRRDAAAPELADEVAPIAVADVTPYAEPGRVDVAQPVRAAPAVRAVARAAG